MELIHGDIVHAPVSSGLEVHENSWLAVENGLVQGIYDTLPDEMAGLPKEDYGRALIIPPFSDLHVHAPQYAQRGTGMDLLLSDWLSSYTFPEEAKFADGEYAEKMYSMFADDLAANGTLHAAVFATVHTPSAVKLAGILGSRGITGFVGKVNMDRSSPDSLLETTNESVKATEEFLSAFDSDSKVKPILTPRFAPTCSSKLLHRLGELSHEYKCGMQTHLVESIWEAGEAKRLFPDCSCDAHIYEKAGLLDNGPVIFAHFIYPSADDMRIARDYGAVTVHCPDATTNVIAGIMPVGAVSKAGIPVAMGSDIGAGSFSGIYRQAASCVRFSKIKELYEPDIGSTVTFPEAFRMSTKVGGSVFGNYGSFEKGMVFEALVLDGLEDGGFRLPAEKRLERFCYNGDSRNIKKIIKSAI